MNKIMPLLFIILCSMLLLTGCKNNNEAAGSASEESFEIPPYDHKMPYDQWYDKYYGDHDNVSTDGSMTAEEKEILDKKSEYYQKQAEALKENDLKAIQIINRYLNTKYEYLGSFGEISEKEKAIMEEVIKVIDTMKPTHEELEILIGYLGNRYLSVLETDPIYYDLVRILEVENPMGPNSTSSDTSVVSEEFSSDVRRR